MDEDEVTFEKLDRAYREAMAGTEPPDEMWIRCDKCNKSFHLTVDGPNTVCNHLMAALRLIDGLSE